MIGNLVPRLNVIARGRQGRKGCIWVMIHSAAHTDSIVKSTFCASSHFVERFAARASSSYLSTATRKGRNSSTTC